MQTGTQVFIARKVKFAPRSAFRWARAMDRLVGRVGTVARVPVDDPAAAAYRAEGVVAVEVPKRGRRRGALCAFPPGALVALPRVGSYVQVTGRVDFPEGASHRWTPSMSDLVWTSGRVVEVTEAGIVRVSIRTGCGDSEPKIWGFMPQSLRQAVV